MDEQQLQKAFASYLMQLSGAKTEKELQAYIQKLGKDGLQKVYQQFMTELQKQQGAPKMARHGAKLDFIKKLNRVECNADEKAVYYKVGGKFCKKCQKREAEVQAALPTQPIQEAATGTKFVQGFKKQIAAERCGGKSKKK